MTATPKLIPVLLLAAAVSTPQGSWAQATPTVPAATPPAQAPAAAASPATAPATAGKGEAAKGGAPAAAAPDADEIVGEVVVLPSGRSASYGERRVVGPRVNLARSSPGEWAGRIRDFDGTLTVSEDRIAGANFNLVLDRDGDELSAQGLWDGKRVRVVVSASKITARVDVALYELERVAPDLFATVPQGPAVRVKGDATKPNPMQPQLLLALLGVL